MPKSIGVFAIKGGCVRTSFGLDSSLESKQSVTLKQDSVLKPFPLAILFSGNGSNLQNLILQSKSIEQGLQPYGIQPYFALGLSNVEDAYGITRCKNLGIPCEVVAHRDFATREAFEQKICAILHGYEIKFVVLAGFMRILTPYFVAQFPSINIHPSFLPLHKGAHAIKESFLSDEDYAGVSVHWVSDELDSGSMIMQEKISKKQGESFEEFERRIHDLEYEIYPKALVQALISHVSKPAL